MNVKDREGAILGQLERHGASSYQQLSELLEVSMMTVRRDVDKLARREALIKTLGGAQRASAPPSFYETSLLTRLAEYGKEKQAIARKALERVKSGQTLFLDGSTTCVELAKLLARNLKGLTLITASAMVCVELGRSGDNTIVCLGGQYDPASSCFVGPTSEDAAHNFYVDVAFMSTKGFLPAEGTFESSMPNFRIKQIIAKQCDELVLMVDHSKFGQRALCKVLYTSQINTVITDENTSQADVEALEKRGLAVCIATANAVGVEASGRVT